MAQGQPLQNTGTDRMMNGIEIYAGIRDFRRLHQDDEDFERQFNGYLIERIHEVIDTLGEKKEQLWLLNRSLGAARAQLLKAKLRDQRNEIHRQELQGEIDFQKRDTGLRLELADLKTYEESTMLSGTGSVPPRSPHTIIASGPFVPRSLAEYDEEFRRISDAIAENVDTWETKRERLVNRRIELSTEILRAPFVINDETPDVDATALANADDVGIIPGSIQRPIVIEHTPPPQAEVVPAKQLAHFDIYVDESAESTTNSEGIDSSPALETTLDDTVLSVVDRDLELEAVQYEDLETESCSSSVTDRGILFDESIAPAADRTFADAKSSEIGVIKENRQVVSPPPRSPMRGRKRHASDHLDEDLDDLIGAVNKVNAVNQVSGSAGNTLIELNPGTEAVTIASRSKRLCRSISADPSINED